MPSIFIQAKRYKRIYELWGYNPDRVDEIDQEDAGRFNKMLRALSVEDEVSNNMQKQQGAGAKTPMRGGRRR